MPYRRLPGPAARPGLQTGQGRPASPSFAGFAEAAGARTVTIDLALRWSVLPEGASPVWAAQRLSVVRGFARYLQAVDPAVQVPPAELLPARTHRAIPYLYSDADITALMAAARRLRNPLKAATFETLIGLLVVTGMRGSEAMRLDRDDLDDDAGMLTVRATKFRKSRQLPLHETTLRALGGYQAQRDQLCPAPTTASLLVSSTGARLCHATVQPVFRHLARHAEVGRNIPKARPGHPRPASYVRGQDPARLVPGRPGRAGPHAGPVDLPRPRRPSRHVLVPVRHSRAARPGGRAPGGHARGCPMTALAPTLQAFFTERLIAQRQVSGHTVAAYRDTFRLLLGFAQERTGTAPCDLSLDDLDAGLIGAFLEHLRHDRRNGARTRNARLAAVHSLFRYAALRHPEHAAHIQRVLAIPPARFEKAPVSYLTPDEAEALLAAPDRTRWAGRRDHALLTVAIQTGLRVSELTGLTSSDVHLGAGPHVRCLGKGRKERCTPLTSQVARVLRAWQDERGGGSADPLFPTSRGQPLSRDAVELLVARHVTTAQATCPTLCSKTVSPHVLRHTAAMSLLHAGVDITVIALWLGHERAETAQIYIHADQTLKQRALDRTTPPGTRPGRYRPPDSLLAFLEQLS